jgi:hypothetical protein
MPLYLSVSTVQPFAKIATEPLEGEPGVTIVTGDGKLVGIRLDKTSDVVRLPGLIEKLDLDAERVWSRVQGDSDLTQMRGF